ncbi:MAG TPA: hypothetical protein PK323_14965, partial [Bacteroidia bacterium]|nr:hypothetical protein [Bacteroidia bacterium]
MKRFIIISFFLFNYIFELKAQIDSFNYSSFNRALHEVWSGLNTDSITTGILIDKINVEDNLTFYQDGGLNDSITNVYDWLLFYNSLRYGKNDSLHNMKEMVDFIHYADSFSRIDHAIELSLLNFNYNKLKSNAITNNLISIVDNHKLVDNPNRTENPYTKSKVFSICPIVIQATSFRVCFLLRNELILGNSDTLTENQISYDEGITYEPFLLNTPFCHTFTDTGIIKLFFKSINNKGDTLYCKSNMYLKQSNEFNRSSSCDDLAIPDIGPEMLFYSNGEPGGYDNIYNDPNNSNPVTTISAHYAVWKGCNIPGQLNKPYLSVAGFNPKNSKTLLCYDDDYGFQLNGFPVGQLLSINESDFLAKDIWRGTYYETCNGAYWPDFRGWNNDNPLKMMNNQTRYLQSLREKGYDIWILAVDNGVDFAKNNALLVAKMINKMNDYYLNEQLQTEELVVMGYSAGAWATRYALSMMERYKKMYPQSPYYHHHRVKLWISNEGEFYGANTPIGFQHFMKFLGSTIPATAAGILNTVIASQTSSIIGSASAQELSRYTIKSGTLFSVEKQSLQDDIESQNQNTRGYPEWCRKVALSQGSGVGIETENPALFPNRFAPGEVMFDYKEEATINNLTPIGFRPAREGKSFWIRDGNNPVIIKKSGFKMYLLGIPISYVSGSTQTIVQGDFKGWDHCPGGTQSTPNIAFYNMKNPRFFSTFGINIPVNPFSHFNYDLTTHSFSPTVGGFDLRTPLSNYESEEDVFCNIDNKYDFFQIRKDNFNAPKYSLGHRYGYPYLMNGKIINGVVAEYKKITPFDAVCAVGDKNTYPTILPNHFHVDDFQPDFLDFLLGEIASDTVYIQNRDIGNNTENYIAGFHTANYIYCGNSVFQKHSNEWKEPPGEVVMNQNAKIDMRAKE